MATWQPAPRMGAAVDGVASAIRSADEWLIVTHERPDGDALGSALAMAHILNALGKTWTVGLSEAMPLRFRFLPLSDGVDVMSHSEERRFTNVIAVDCADPGRFAELSRVFSSDVQIVNIDHHRTNPMYGVAQFVDESAAATCELVFHLAHALGVAIDQDLATCLYTGILTDTGGFVQPNTSQEIHQIAGELLKSGVRPYDVAEPALEARSWEQMHLLQMALANLAVSSNGRYAALYVTRGMLEGAGATDDDVEGLVGFARSIDTVEVGLLFRETPDGRVKVSLRSKRLVDVAKIAGTFGGGGHVRAAGCTLDCDLDAAMDLVVERVEEALAQS